jgi:hypothetical protein
MKELESFKVTNSAENLTENFMKYLDVLRGEMNLRIDLFLFEVFVRDSLRSRERFHAA